MSIRTVLKIPNDFGLGIAFLYPMVYEFLPLLNLIKAEIRGGIEIIFVFMFYVCVFQKNRRLFLKFIFIICVAILVHFWSFSNSYHYYYDWTGFIFKEIRLRREG